MTRSATTHDYGTTAHAARAERFALALAQRLAAQRAADAADAQRRAARALARRRALTRALSA